MHEHGLDYAVYVTTWCLLFFYVYSCLADNLYLSTLDWFSNGVFFTGCYFLYCTGSVVSPPAGKRDKTPYTNTYMHRESMYKCMNIVCVVAVWHILRVCNAFEATRVAAIQIESWTWSTLFDWNMLSTNRSHVQMYRTLPASPTLWSECTHWCVFSVVCVCVVRLLYRARFVCETMS
jgi:hypothetical protein